MSDLRFEGYCEASTLPLRTGDTIVLEKGMKYEYRGETKVVKRRYQVSVHQMLPGTTDTRNYCSEHKHIMNPSIRWPGAGGYWNCMDINEYLNWKPS